MGWSIELIRPDLDGIFAKLGVKYDIQRPDSLSPRVVITYDGKLPPTTIKYIVNLFPEAVYVDFMRFSATGTAEKKEG